MGNKSNKYSEFLDEKKVVLVGPSWHTKGLCQGDAIDSYDVVARMNLGYRVPEKMEIDIGKRMDILYCSLSNYYLEHDYFNKKILKEISLKASWFSLTHNKIHKQSSKKLKKMNEGIDLPIYMVEDKVYKNINQQTVKKPSCGIIAIIDLLRYNIKQLYITGFTFYDTKVIGKRRIYYSNYNKDKVIYSKRPFGSHNLNAELSMLKEMCSKDNRIVCDDVLSNIIKQGKIITISGKVANK